MNNTIIKITAGITLVIFVGALADYTRSVAKGADHEVPKAFAISAPSSNKRDHLGAEHDNRQQDRASRDREGHQTQHLSTDAIHAQGQQLSRDFEPGAPQRSELGFYIIAQDRGGRQAR
jgi:hypothetical protein